MASVRKDTTLSGNWLHSAHFQNLATSFNTMLMQNNSGFGQFQSPVRPLPSGSLCHHQSFYRSALPTIAANTSRPALDFLLRSCLTCPHRQQGCVHCPLLLTVAEAFLAVDTQGVTASARGGIHLSPRVTPLPPKLQANKHVLLSLPHPTT